MDEVGLCFRCPDGTARPVSVPISWPIKRNDPIILRSKVNKSASLKVLNHTPVAVQQNQRRSRTLFHVVKTNPLDSNEPTFRRIFALRLLRKISIGNRHNS